MITITNTPETLSIQGHAHSGPGPANKTEVEACSAITALMHQLLGCLTAYEHDEFDHKRQKGYFYLDKRTLWRKDLIDYFMIGAELVQSGYPKCIKIIEER